jgi:hypothetical protein
MQLSFANVLYMYIYSAPLAAPRAGGAIKPGPIKHQQAKDEGEDDFADADVGSLLG